jgi:hypothetical protein
MVVYWAVTTAAGRAARAATAAGRAVARKSRA